MARYSDDPAPEWVTASDLAEYAYCPRALWYRRHPPPDGPSRSSQVARAEGERFHVRTLQRRARAERWSGVGWLLVGLGLLLVVVAVLSVARP